MTDTLFVFIMDLPKVPLHFSPIHNVLREEFKEWKMGHAVLILGGMSLAPSSSLLSSRT